MSVEEKTEGRTDWPAALREMFREDPSEQSPSSEEAGEEKVSRTSIWVEEMRKFFEERASRKSPHTEDAVVGETENPINNEM